MHFSSFFAILYGKERKETMKIQGDLQEKEKAEFFYQNGYALGQLLLSVNSDDPMVMELIEYITSTKAEDDPRKLETGCPKVLEYLKENPLNPEIALTDRAKYEYACRVVHLLVVYIQKREEYLTGNLSKILIDTLRRIQVCIPEPKMDKAEKTEEKYMESLLTSTNSSKFVVK